MQATHNKTELAFTKKALQQTASLYGCTIEFEPCKTAERDGFIYRIYKNGEMIIQSYGIRYSPSNGTIATLKQAKRLSATIAAVTGYEYRSINKI